MTEWKRSVLTLVVAGAAVGCGGPRATPEPAPPPSEAPTPWLHELARLQQAGRLDQARLACSAEALASAGAELLQQVPLLYDARPARSYRTGASGHARSVQAGMASGDTWTAAMRRVSQARQVAAYATRVGDEALAANASNDAMRALDVARRGSGESPAPWFRRAGTPFTYDDGALLTETAALFPEVLAGEASPDVQARVAEIGEQSPRVMDAYAGLMLHAYVDPDLNCEPGGPDGR